MSLDPLKDGWPTEHLSVIAGKQLKKLAHLIETRDVNNSVALGGLFTESVECDAFRPANLQTVFQNESTEILRAALPGSQEEESRAAPSEPRMALRDNLQAFCNTLPLDSRQSSKFKIIRVQRTDDGFMTTQLIAFNANTSRVAYESNATWQIDWEFATGPDNTLPGDAVPKIQRVRITDYEEVRCRGGVWFTDCTSSVLRKEPEVLHDQFGVGIDAWINRLDAYQLVLQFGHNATVIGDVNNDGLDDLFRAQVGGLPNRLLMAQDDGTLRDVTRWAGLDYLDNTRGALLLDLDNDGDQDLAAAMPLEVVVFENNGKGQFQPRSRHKLENVFSMAAADFDNDGDLDIYTCVYYNNSADAATIPVPMPLYDAKNGGANVILQNEGNLQFSDVTEKVGLNEDNVRFSYAAVWEDYDNDGQLDLFVVNDFGPNNLYHNRAGQFEHVTQQSQTINGTFGMSGASADYNHDGLVDFYKASMFSSAGNRVSTQPHFLPEADDALRRNVQQLAWGNSLYTNLGNGRFRDDGQRLGVAMGRWSWGSIFVDLDNDSWEDLYISNGFVSGRKTDDL